MPRVKKYNRDEVLAKAMWVFWNKGYLGTSIQDLVEGMGINRFSIYDAFKSKEELFLLSLRKYRSQILNPQLAILTDSSQGLESISVYFKSFVALTTSGKVPASCLMINTIAEFGRGDAKVLEVTDVYLQDLKYGFLSALTRAKKSEEISASTDTLGLAQMLLGLAQGLGVLVRTQPAKDLQALVDHARVFLSGKISEGSFR